MHAAHIRQGLYPSSSFPAIQGYECAGIIAALPTDADVLANKEYQKRGLKLGGKVAAVRLYITPLSRHSHTLGYGV